MTETPDNTGAVAKPEKKPLSEAQLRQRREAAQKSTGPRTEVGKAVSSRNAWKTGEYSQLNQFFQNSGMMTLYRPCKSTCPQFDSCPAVAEGLTQPGGDCKDTRYFVEAFTAIMDSLTSGSGAGVHGLMAQQMAQATEVIRQVVQAISENGVIMEQPVYDKEGGQCGIKYIDNPVLGHYAKLLGQLNIDFGQLMLTPKEIAAHQTENEKTDAVRDMMADVFRLNQVGNGPVLRGVTIDGETEA